MPHRISILPAHESRLNYLKRQKDFTREDKNGDNTYNSFYFLTRLCKHAMDVHNGRFIVPMDEMKMYFEGCLNRDVIERHLRKIETFANHHGITIPQ